MGAFTEAIDLFVDQATRENLPNYARRVGLAVLADIVTRSPVGDPKRWKINAAFAEASINASAMNAARRKSSMYSRNGKLKSGAKVRPEVMINFTTRTGKQVSFAQRGWAAKNYTGGRFRGNWQVTFNHPAVGTVDRIDKSGQATLAAGGTVLATYVATETASIWFTNNLPYAQRLENGWSGQAPTGILRITAAKYLGGGL